MSFYFLGIKYHLLNLPHLKKVFIGITGRLYKGDNKMTNNTNSKVYGYIDDQQASDNLEMMRHKNLDVGNYITKCFKYYDLLQNIFTLIEKGLIKV